MDTEPRYTSEDVSLITGFSHTSVCHWADNRRMKKVKGHYLFSERDIIKFAVKRRGVKIKTDNTLLGLVVVPGEFTAVRKVKNPEKIKLTVLSIQLFNNKGTYKPTVAVANPVKEQLKPLDKSQQLGTSKRVKLEIETPITRDDFVRAYFSVRGLNYDECLKTFPWPDEWVAVNNTAIKAWSVKHPEEEAVVPHLHSLGKIEQAVQRRNRRFLIKFLRLALFVAIIVTIVLFALSQHS